MPGISGFGETVAKFREEKGMSQEELGFETGMARNTIQRIEEGSTPKVDKVDPLCSALGITPNMLFGYDDPFLSLDPALVNALRIIAVAGKGMSQEKQKNLAAMLELQAGLFT